jgi:hypothetical protein
MLFLGDKDGRVMLFSLPLVLNLDFIGGTIERNLNYVVSNSWIY